ncbi:MAG: hypothetical protein AAF810_19215 [Cyanobacteria bacterium P01_D01_bin.36]
MMKPWFSLLLSLSVVLPTATVSLPAARAHDAYESVINRVVVPLSQFDIEERVEQIGESVQREYTFTGNADEYIVAYSEQLDETPYIGAFKLYNAGGLLIPTGPYYPDDINFAELEGRHTVFTLPETGEYRLVYSADVSSLLVSPIVENLLEPAESEEQSAPSEPFNYLLRARVATDYEQFMIAGVQLIDNEEYEAARPIFEQAINESPDLPLPYVGRIISYGTPVFYAIDFNAMGESPWDAIYEVFLTLDADVQMLLINDFKQVEATYTAALEQGQPPISGFDGRFFAEIAAFLETGIPSAYLEESDEW